jgi:hypothetical protein
MRKVKPTEEMEYFPLSEQLVEVLKKKTQSDNPLFFRVMVAYYFAKVASMMRVNIDTLDRGEIPINVYALNLAPSGMGKGLSTNILEDQVLKKFRDRFLSETYPIVAQDNLTKIAVAKAKKKKTDPDEELIKVQKEFSDLGALAFSFDSGTPAAIKQMRHQLLMANAGSLCFEMDEVGSNISNNIDLLNVFIELYDVGKVKQKMTKNTQENKRNEEIIGRTPANMLLFGTPTKLLDGSRQEQEFFTMLETGYARRFLFGYVERVTKKSDLTPEEMFDMLTDKTSSLHVDTIATKLEDLADAKNFGMKLMISKDVTLELLAYQRECTKQAEVMRDHEEVLKAEVSHRYFRALKLAGAYAFMDGSTKITMDHLHSAIKLVEDSGAAFKRILTRDKPYVKLAKYIANIGRDVTQVDLVEDLPFYKGSESQRRDMMNLAIAHGYQNNIIIKKSYSDGIEFLRGEALQETDLSNITCAYSQEITYNYTNTTASWDEMFQLTSVIEDIHYTAHHFTDGHRNSDNLIEGFNLVILDVDSGVSLDTAKMLLKDYKCLFATTKRHRTSGHGDRFRIIMPLSHTLKLTAKDYSKFMQNIFEWLPFEVDAQTKDPARKWQGNPGGSYEYNEGELLDAMLFIPQTKKSEEQREINARIGSLTNLERWFLHNTGEGNRSNMMHKYAMALVDDSYTIEQVRSALLSFNAKLPDGIPEEEINSTIMITVTKAITKKEVDKENAA